jgi:hypothetical protein
MPTSPGTVSSPVGDGVRPRRPSRSSIAVVLGLVAFLTAAGVSVTIMQYSRAAFSASTSNSANNWATGSVVLSNDSSGTAMFSATNMTAGQSVVKCIAVTYSGTLTSGVAVRLYGVAAGALAPYLNLTVEQGTGGGYSSCTGFSGSQIYSGTVSGFAATYTNFGTGLTGWAPGTNPDSRTYRFTVTVQNDNNAQSKSATADYTWEVQG